MVAVCVGLGVWQLQRRVEKHALIAALTERLAAAPAALPPPSQWSALTPERDEFRRVSFSATYRPVRMRWSTVPARRFATILPVRAPGRSCRRSLPNGETVVINAGFVQNTMQDRAQQDRAVARLITATAGDADRLYPLSRKCRPADTAGKHGKTAVVHPGSSGDGAHARLGEGEAGRAVLHRSGNAGARRAASRNRPRSRSISRTTTCNMPSPGSASRPRW